MQGLSRRIKYRNCIRIIRDLRTTKRWIFLRVQTGQNKMDEPKNRKIETDRRNIYIVRNLINGAIVFILAVFCYEVEYPDRLYLSLVSSLLTPICELWTKNPQTGNMVERHLWTKNPHKFF